MDCHLAKLGPEGMIKLRLSGLEAEALADITSHSVAWSVVGNVLGGRFLMLGQCHMGPPTPTSCVLCVAIENRS